MIVMLLLISASLFYRFYQYYVLYDMERFCKSLTGNAYALFLGSTLKLVNQPISPWAASRIAAIIGMSGISLILVAIMSDYWMMTECIWAPVVAAFTSLPLITGSAAQGNWILELSFFRRVGRVSYSFYLWHHVLFWLSGLFNHMNIPAFGIVCMSWMIADISTIYFEEPIREAFRSSPWFKSQKEKLSQLK